MLREIWAVYRKEMRAYLVSPVPYIFTAIFAAVMAWKFWKDKDTAFFVYDKAEMFRGFFWELEYFLVLLPPVITMGLWSRESDNGTIETLLTLPVRTSSLVIGKFLGGWTLVLGCLVATGATPITVSNLGPMDWGPVHGGYVGAFMFTGALIAVGTWVSSLTRHQIIAFVLTLLIGAGFIAMYQAADDAGSFWGPILEKASLASHYQALGRGVVDFRDIVYFAAFITMFLYLNVQSVENRRYR